MKEGPLDALCASKERWRVRFAGGRWARLTAAGFSPAGEAPDVRHWDGVDVAAMNRALDEARASWRR